MSKMLITFFDTNGIVHYKFILQGYTVNQAYYMEIQKRLSEAVRRKTPELWPDDWFFQHYNPSADKVLHSVKQFLARKK
jgi:hypothetical protein